jgi:hypothetical protein
LDVASESVSESVMAKVKARRWGVESEWEWESEKVKARRWGVESEKVSE